MPNVLIQPLVEHKLDILFDVLLEEDYFSDPENAIGYCRKIRSFIKTIPTQKRRFTADKIWGTYYSAYKANHHTTWYILFDKEDEVYLVRNILNNHTSDYPRFI